MNKSKITCIWGSPSSGKTVCALSLAAVLAQEKKNVIVFSTDKLIPALKLYCPEEEIDSSRSIGSLLMSGRYDDAIFAQKLVPHPESEYIAFLGMAPTDTYITYSAFERSHIVSVINKAAQLADHVIIDGTSNPADDPLTLCAMELSDVVIRVITADIRGLLYLDSARAVYSESKYRFDSHISVLGNVHNVSPVSEVMSVSGKYDHVLPYSPEIENRYIAGELLCDMKRSAGRRFEKQIRDMAKGIEEA